MWKSHNFVFLLHVTLTDRWEHKLIQLKNTVFSQSSAVCVNVQLSTVSLEERTTAQGLENRSL